MRRLLAGLVVAVAIGGPVAVIVGPAPMAGAVSVCSGPNPPPSCGGDPRDPSNPMGSLDSAVRWPGGILVSGWANDRNRAGAAMTVVVKVGGYPTNVVASTPSTRRFPSTR